MLALICLALPAVYGGDRIGGENAATQLQGQIQAVSPEVIKSNTGSTVPPKPFSYRWTPIRADGRGAQCAGVYRR